MQNATDSGKKLVGWAGAASERKKVRGSGEQEKGMGEKAKIIPTYQPCS
jgi:hypothetical protein